MFHVMLFKHRFESELENFHNKIKVEAKENLIHSLVQAIPEGILVIDYSYQKILSNNSYSILANDSISLEYLPHFKPISGAVKKDLKEDIGHFMNSNQEQIVFGAVKSMSLILEVTATKLQWEDTPAVILTFRDVTELIKLEKTVIENISTLQALRGVSHEIKTPLGVIINKTKLMLNKVSENLVQDMKSILSSAKFLQFSVQSMLDYSTLSSGEFNEIL